MADINTSTSLNPNTFLQTISSVVSRSLNSVVSATTKLQVLAKRYFSSNATANCPTWNDEMKNACSKNASLQLELSRLVRVVEEVEEQIATLKKLPHNEKEMASLVQRKNDLYEQIESVRSEILTLFETQVELLKQESDRLDSRLTNTHFYRIFTQT